MSSSEVYEGELVRRVLFGMISNRSVLGRIAVKWDNKKGLFKTREPNILAGLCIRYFQKYDKAPELEIHSLVRGWGETTQDSASIELVENLTKEITANYEAAKEALNPELIIDQAGKLFSRVRLENMVIAINGALALDDVDKAEEIHQKHRKVDIGMGTGVNVLQDEEATIAALTERPKSIIELPGALGEFFGDALSRDSLVSFIAPQKRAKTFCIMELAWLAMLQRKKVLFFEIGDLTQDQIMRRFIVRASERPLKAREVKIPVSMKVSGDECHVETETRAYENPLSLKWVMVQYQKIQEKRIKSFNSYFKLYCYPAGTVSVKQISTVIEELSRDGFEPELVCISEGSLVLTDHGLIPIEKIKSSDRLWDGCNWVSHGGAIYKGVKNVLTYGGLTATPDHEVWTEEGWRTLESCSELGLRIAYTGEGRRNLWIGQDYLSDNAMPQYQLSQIRSELHRKARICVCGMCAMRTQEMGSVSKHQERNRQRMPSLSTAEAISNMVLASFGSCSAEMSESQKLGMEGLWESWNKIPVSNSIRSLYVGNRKSRTSEQKIGDRQSRQQWALRAWEPPLFNSPTELFAHKKKSTYSKNAPISTGLSECTLCGRYFDGHVETGGNARGYCGSVGVHRKKVWKAPVWDILEAGPLHRFTVQGVLVHNCIDYADILAHPNVGTTERRDRVGESWLQLRAMSQIHHCAVLTATQANAKSYKAMLLGMEHFSETNSKMSHVTGLIAINSTSEEKAKEVRRLNWVVLREDDFSPSKCVYVAGCLSLANPFMLSSF